MQETEIIERLRELARTSITLTPDQMAKLGPQTKFTELGADSLDLIELAISVEDAFDMKIPESDLKSFATLEDSVRYVQRRLAERAAP